MEKSITKYYNTYNITIIVSNTHNCFFFVIYITIIEDILCIVGW